MAFFKDLEPCSYFGKWEDSLLSVGWIDESHDFVRGEVGEDFFTALVKVCVDPWQPMISAGRKQCPLCRFTDGPAQLSYRGVTIAPGAGNVFVPGTERVFVAPTMIVHFIDAHMYAPPPEFQDAVKRCPEMKSFAYLKEMKARGLTVAR